MEHVDTLVFYGACPEKSKLILSTFKRIMKICHKRGYPVYADDEYESAVWWGIAQSINNGKDALKLALKACRRTRYEQLRFPGQLKYEPPTLYMPQSEFPIGAIDVLNLVTQHGRVVAAKLLCISTTDLREILDYYLWQINQR